MLDLKKFTSRPIRPTLVGGIGDGGVMDQFHKQWTMRHCHHDAWIVEKRNGSKGCFVISPLENGWDISFYSSETPKKVFNALKVNRPINCYCFQSGPTNKYIAIDLLNILKDNKD